MQLDLVLFWWLCLRFFFFFVAKKKTKWECNFSEARCKVHHGKLSPHNTPRECRFHCCLRDCLFTQRIKVSKIGKNVFFKRCFKMNTACMWSRKARQKYRISSFLYLFHFQWSKHEFTNTNNSSSYEHEKCSIKLHFKYSFSRVDIKL